MSYLRLKQLHQQDPVSNEVYRSFSSFFGRQLSTAGLSLPVNHLFVSFLLKKFPLFSYYFLYPIPPPFCVLPGKLNLTQFFTMCYTVNDCVKSMQGVTMQRLSIREMRSSLGRLDHLLEEAGELIVTRHGKAIARIFPIGQQKKRPSHADLRRCMPYLSTASETLIRRDRDER